MICKNCGNEFEEGTKFCSECGTKVDIEENNSVEIKNEETVEEKENSSQVQDAISVNDNSDKKSFIKEIMADEKKKKIFIVGVIAIIVIFIVIIIAASKSGSNNNYYGNNDSYNSGYNDDNDDFGNNEVVTQPQVTESVTANQNNNYEINYPEGTIYYSYFSEIGMKITDVKTTTTADGNVKIQIEVEKVSQKLTDDLDRRENEDGLWFWLVLNIYDSNGMIIETIDSTLSHLSYDDPVGTEYIMTENSYTFNRDNIDIAKIDIVERH